MDPFKIPADVILASVDDPSVLEPYESADPIDALIAAQIDASRRREAVVRRQMAQERVRQAVAGGDPASLADAVAAEAGVELENRGGPVDFGLQTLNSDFLEPAQPDIILEGPDDSENGPIGAVSVPLTPTWWTLARQNAAYLAALGLPAEQIALQIDERPSVVREWARHPDFRAQVGRLQGASALAAYKMICAWSTFAVRNIVAIAQVGTKAHDTRLKASIQILRLAGVDPKRFERDMKREDAAPDALANIVRYIEGQARIVKDADPESADVWDFTREDSERILGQSIPDPTSVLPSDAGSLDDSERLAPGDLLDALLGGFSTGFDRGLRRVLAGRGDGGPRPVWAEDAEPETGDGPVFAR